jgi:capsular polysaccharide biosynthesis protein
MSTPNYVRLILRSWRYVLLATLAGLVLALAFSFVQPFRYSSSVKILITQANVAGLDPYTAVKSTERIAQNLGEIVATSAFFNAVTQDPSVDASYFPADELKKRKKWEDAVETVVTPGTGVMTVIAYHPVRDQATTLALRVSQQLVKEAPDLFGFSVRAQVIDAPVPSRFFAKPDFFMNAAYGAVAGFLLGLAWVLGKAKE